MRRLPILALCAAASALAQSAAPLPSTAKPLDAAKLERSLERLKNLPPAEAAAEAQKLQRDLASQVSPAKAALLPGRTEPSSEAEWVRNEASLFFTHMLAGDARALVEHASFPFILEDRRVGTPEELLQEWLKALRAKRTDLLTLYGIEVLSPAEMEKKYGKPPARISLIPWKAPRTYLAVANLSGHPAIAVLRDSGGGAWRVIAYHD